MIKMQTKDGRSVFSIGFNFFVELCNQCLKDNLLHVIVVIVYTLFDSDDPSIKRFFVVRKMYLIECSKSCAIMGQSSNYFDLKESGHRGNEIFLPKD